MIWGLLAIDVVLAVLALRARRTALGVWLAVIVSAFVFTGQIGFLVLGTIGAALLLGQPLFVLMGALAMLLLAVVSGYATLEEQVLVVRQLLGLAGKEVLLAIPFFVVAGEIMTQGSLARRLIDFMRAAVGWLPGGLAVAAVAACVFFAAISGSSPVTVVAIGSIMVPALVKAKYPEDFSIGLLTSAGSLGILIPPSIPMIVYSIMVSSATPVDPTALFIAGVMPGLFIGGLLAVYGLVQGFRLGVAREPFSRERLWRATREGFWSLLLPLIILGGIYSGLFTATEASAVSVVYALVVELWIHRELDLKKLVSVAENSMTVMGSILVIIALATALNFFLVGEQVPDRMVGWLQAQQLNSTTFLLAVNGLLLLVGAFMDILSAILVIAPMLAPMAVAMGVDPIHMGIIFIVNLEIGYLTPPIGLNLFVSSTLFKKGLEQVVRAVLPTLGLLLLSLVVVTWVPGLSLALGRLLDAKPAVEAPAARPDAPAATPSAPKEKSLEELMREAKEKKSPDAGEPKRVKSLEELMQEAKDKKLAPEAAPADEPKRVKSLEELMREAKEKKAAELDAGSE